MKHFFFIAALVSTQAFAASPDAIAGKVFRLYTSYSGRPDTSESTIVLSSDGRYNYLKYATGTLPAPVGGYHGVIAIQTPLGDGTFAYHRTGEATGTLDLTGDDSVKHSFDLVFSSLTAGNIAGSLAGLNPFYLTDLSAAQTAPLTNTSVRGQVSPNRQLIAGFVVPGTQEREILVRVVGPTLTQFGVANAWVDPDFMIFQGNGLRAYVRQSAGGDWCTTPSGSSVSPEAGLRNIFTYLGAFPLVSGSNDAVEVVRLAPGIYTLMSAAAPSDPGGEALIEIYVLP